MGKTIRRDPRSGYRRMNGRRKAIVNNARKGAIPPDPWDDYPHSRECTRWFTIFERMRASKPDWSVEKLTKKMLKKVKGCTYLRMYHWIIDILEWKRRMEEMRERYRRLRELRLSKDPESEA